MSKVSYRSRNPETRELTLKCGHLTFLGAESYPHLLSVTWEGELPEPVKLTAAIRMAANADSLMTVFVGPLSLAELPDTWALNSPEELLHVLQMFMPGHWDKTHVTKLSQQMAGGVKCPQDLTQLNWVATAADEVTPLLECLHMEYIHTILEPFAGTGGISSVLQENKHVVITNDLNPQHDTLLHEDSLQPGFYKRIMQVTDVDMVILSPWFAHLDVALPLAVLAAKTMVAVHVPAHYWTNAIMARYSYLKPFFTADRAHFVWGLPRGPTGMRCAWICIFATSALKYQLLKKGSYIPHTMTLPL